MNATSRNYGYVDFEIEIVHHNIEEDDLQSVDIFHRFREHYFELIESTAFYEAYVHVLLKI